MNCEESMPFALTLVPGLLDELLQKIYRPLIQENVCEFWVVGLWLSDKFEGNVAVMDDFNRNVLLLNKRIPLLQEFGHPKERSLRIRS
jgi:hypothetical protein